MAYKRQGYTNKNIWISDGLMERVRVFRHDLRLRTEQEAIEALLRIGLDTDERRGKRVQLLAGERGA